MVGNFPDVSFPDLIQFYCMSKKTVAIRISTPDLPEGRGEFFVADGELLDARFGERVGVDALQRALHIRRGSFEVEVDVRPPMRRIHVPLNEVLLHGMQAKDADGREPSPPLASTRSDDLLSLADTPGDRLCPDCATWHAEDAFCPEPATQPVHTGPSVAAAPDREGPVLEQAEPDVKEESTRKLAGLAIIGGCLLAGIIALFVLFSLKPKEAPAVQGPTAAAAQSAGPAPTIVPPPPLSSVQGVSPESVLFGLAAPFSGPSKELGREMRVGLEAAFAQANEAGASTEGS